MPQTAIAQSIAIAAMPTFSAQAALGKFQELRSSLSSSLRGVLLLALPAAAGLILIRYPLFRLFESGEFTAASTQLVAWAILWYALGLPTHSLLEVVVRAFYALRDTRTPVTVTVIAMLLNVGFSLTFPGWFSAAGWPALGGLALASTLATTLECGVLIYLLHRRLGSQVQAAFASLSSQTQAAHAPPSGMEGARISGAALQGGFGSLVMGIGLAAWLAISRPLPDWLILGVGVVLGAVIYALTLFSLKVPEVNDLLAAASRRFKLANNKN
jgi:putative peptidoglycan lipid II flippase